MDNNCVFCDRTQFEERIIAENNNFYIIATLGQIRSGYVLIIPKRHVSCFGAMKGLGIIQIDDILLSLSDYIEIEYGIRPIVFEYGVVGQTIQHAHLHLLPAKIRMCGRIYQDFPNAQICFLDSLKILRCNYDMTGRKKYLLWSTPEGLLKAVIDPPAPPQYLRIIAAELDGHPERANWRNMDPELDKQLWQETVNRLKPYYS
ncbi:MAG: HIT domain-containing protein [Candidatus Azambacteria bacterium]|nr:HIT domain-containing protein [Candidatus Azambacteria bacterium]